MPPPVASLIVTLLLLAPGTHQHAQSGPVTTVLVNGTPVRPAQHRFVYRSSLTVGDVRLQDGSRGKPGCSKPLPARVPPSSCNPKTSMLTIVPRFDAPFGEQIASHDDSGGGTHPQLRLRLPRTGTYFITATTFGEGQALGRYSLDVDLR